MDINALKEKLASLNRKTNKQNDIWKPKDEHDIRLLPYPHDGDPFIERSFHYDIGDGPVLCPKANFGDDCDICDFASALASFKTPDGEQKSDVVKKQDWELFKKIQTKARIFVPVAERSSDASKALEPKFWGIAAQTATEILAVCADGDRLSELGIDKDDTANALKVIFDPVKAYDLHVSFAKPGEKNNKKQFGISSVTGKIKATPLGRSKKETEEVLKAVKNINDVYPRVSSAEVSKIFKKFLGGASPEARAEGGTEKYAKKEEKKAPSNTKEDAKLSGTRSIDEAFSDMAAE